MVVCGALAMRKTMPWSSSGASSLLTNIGFSMSGISAMTISANTSTTGREFRVACSRRW
ncbi:hypothetical protein D3C78_1444610 [compost metagenome]